MPYPSALLEDSLAAAGLYGLLPLFESRLALPEPETPNQAESAGESRD